VKVVTVVGHQHEEDEPGAEQESVQPHGEERVADPSVFGDRAEAIGELGPRAPQARDDGDAGVAAADRG
jgi:hypothetical protein